MPDDSTFPVRTVAPVTEDRIKIAEIRPLEDVDPELAQEESEEAEENED